MTTKHKYWLTKLHGAEFKIMRLQETATREDILSDTPERTVAYLRSKLPESIIYRPDVENFGVVLLSTRRRIIGWELIGTGILDTLLVHPREVFKPAIVMNASAFIAFHNHPSGDPTPSEADIKVTRDLIRAGQLMKIELLDHVILGSVSSERTKDYSSLRELGYFYS